MFAIVSGGPAAWADPLAGEVLKWLDDPAALASLQQKFGTLHQDLKRNGAQAASELILDLAGIA